MSLYKLLDEVKEALRPDAHSQKVLSDFLTRLNHQIRLHQLDVNPLVGGSHAKDTALRGDHDIDVFLAFPINTSLSDEQMSDVTEDVLKPFKPKRLHGSRDYFEVDFKDFTFDIVPVIGVGDAGSARNITDVSPLHVNFFEKHGSHLTDEVRLAKQFCKAAGCYGAESYIRGFSGHVIDLLVVNYGSFYDLVKAGARWKAPVAVSFDPDSSFDFPNKGPLVVVDPVQPRRNASAALSKKQFDTFVQTCKDFLKNPSEKFFVVKEFSLMQLKSRLSLSKSPAFIAYLIPPDDAKRDVAGARVRKGYEFLLSQFEDHGFEVVDKGWHFDHEAISLAYFVIAQSSLSRLKVHHGPPVSKSKDVDRFEQLHHDVFVEDQRMKARVERKIRTPRRVLEHSESDLESFGLAVTFERVDGASDE